MTTIAAPPTSTLDTEHHLRRAVVAVTEAWIASGHSTDPAVADRLLAIALELRDTADRIAEVTA